MKLDTSHTLRHNNFDPCNVRYTTRVRAVYPWSETFAKIKMTRKPFAFTVNEEKKQTFLRPTFRHHPSRLSSPPRLGTSSAKCLLGSVTAKGELSFGRSVNCEQWLVLPSLQSYCTRNLSTRITWWFAIALDEIRTRRILGEKADYKQSSGVYKTWVSGVSGGKREAEGGANLLSLSLLGRPDTQAIVSGGSRPSEIRGVPGPKNNLFRIIYFGLKIRRGRPLDPPLIVYIKDRKNLKVNKSECRGKHHTKACFKRRATALLSWLDCSTTIARHGFRRRI